MATSEFNAARPTVTVTPLTGLIDEPIRMAVRGAAPGQQATVRAHLVDPRGVSWSSHAKHIGDAEGAFVVDAETLISSLAIAGPGPNRTFDSTSVAPLDVEFVAEIDGQTVASATARRLYVADDVRTTVVRDHGLSGLYFVPATRHPRPGLLVLGGSSGGLLFASQAAALLAGHGFPSLALAYFGTDDLPPHLIDIPLEYFSTALDWLASQRDVRADALGVVGRSRGAELALLLGSRTPRLRAVVAYCPSSIVWSGLRVQAPVERSAWSVSRRAVPFCSMLTPDLAQTRARVFDRLPIELTPLFEAALTKSVPPATVIAVENTNGPILLISGDDDRMWPSARMGDQVMSRLAARRHPFQSRHHQFAGAGHLLRPPGVSTHVLSNTFAFGGEARAQAAANRGAWTITLAFLSESLEMSTAAATTGTEGGQRC